MPVPGLSVLLPYPERFYATASYAGFGESSDDRAFNISTSKFGRDAALWLYAFYQQATVGPCNAPKPEAWTPIELSKWDCWNALGNMASTEAMCRFVRTYEELDPLWFSRARSRVRKALRSVGDVPMNHTSKAEAVIENENATPGRKTVSTENGTHVVSEGNELISVYDQWVAPPIMGLQPKPRYQHGAAVLGDKMYVHGGNHNGRYLSDLQILDLGTWTWSRVEVKAAVQTEYFDSPVPPSSCAGHVLISWNNDLYSVGGHTKDSSETIQVRKFDTETSQWSILWTNGKAPVSRGGHSVTVLGGRIFIFGGEDANRTLLNDLHILDLDIKRWRETDAVGVPPSPRSGHATALHAQRYLLVFGGGSHATCFNDLHVLDLNSMEWSRPPQQGDIPSPRAGHAGVTIGENWFIVGGGDNKGGASETVVLNMDTIVWSSVTSVQGRVPLASEGLSLVVGTYNGQEVLVSFGGYNGHYNNEVHVLKPSRKSTLALERGTINMPIRSTRDTAVGNVANGTRGVRSERNSGQGGGIRETNVDNVKVEDLKWQQIIRQHLEKLKNQQSNQDSAEAETQNKDLHKELKSLRAQLNSEEYKSYCLEFHVEYFRKQLKAAEKELDVLRVQTGTFSSEQVLLRAKEEELYLKTWRNLVGPKEDNA